MYTVGTTFTLIQAFVTVLQYGKSTMQISFSFVEAISDRRRGESQAGNWVTYCRYTTLAPATASTQSWSSALAGCQIDRLPPGVQTTRSPPVPAISHASYAASGLTERILPSAKCTVRYPSLYALA